MELAKGNYIRNCLQFSFEIFLWRLRRSFSLWTGTWTFNSPLRSSPCRAVDCTGGYLWVNPSILLWDPPHARGLGQKDEESTFNSPLRSSLNSCWASTLFTLMNAFNSLLRSSQLHMPSEWPESNCEPSILLWDPHPLKSPMGGFTHPSLSILLWDPHGVFHPPPPPPIPFLSILLWDPPDVERRLRSLCGCTPRPFLLILFWDLLVLFGFLVF